MYRFHRENFKMNANEEQAVHTCGVCEVILDRDEIPQHPCMEGFDEIYIDRNFYIYPRTVRMNSLGMIREGPAINKIADAISNLAAPVPPVPLPPPPTQDDVDGLFLILGRQLRQLPERERATLILDVLQFVNQKLNH